MVMAGETIGFVGLGVMGEPICRNIRVRTGRPVTAFDLRLEPLERLAEVGVRPAGNLAEVAGADLILLSLPGGPELEASLLGDRGLIHVLRQNQTIVDLGTSPVGLTRQIADRLAGLGVAYADAPVARTRQAAIDGTLSIMVGADRATFERIRPVLMAAASEVTHCGAVGAGQVVKLMNNMVLFQTVVALAEALAIGRAAGVDGTVLFETLGKGSADSFALRNHGMKAMLPGDFPKSAFPTDYAIKDIAYALELAADAGIGAEGAALALRTLRRSSQAGNGARYFPALIELYDQPPD
jgi:3-hydroxyisobutyrate dehydrogenase-like beta-hydroxyacid dehydrogenase